MSSHLEPQVSRSPASIPADREPVRVQVAGDLFHGRLPQRPGIPVVYVGRAAPGLPASRYANRHRVGTCRVCRHEHDQADAVNAYARDLAGQPDLVAAARVELAGADLACWCRPEARCHGDVLLRVTLGELDAADADDLEPSQ